ncbi:hypothetical protein [Actinomyces sp. W5033]|uniref:hypothetical protein n=1 Tax=Actinomyces sp. W5033 TaxID=3446479 RepID=UPI003EE29280
MSALLLIPGLHWAVSTGILVCSAAVAAIAVADPARRAADGGGAGWLLGAGLLSGIGWGAVALRSGTRAAPDWSEFIASPIGPIPEVYIRSLSQGPDTAALVVWPLVMVLLGGGAGPKLLVAQAVVSGFAVVAALWMGGED